MRLGIRGKLFAAPLIIFIAVIAVTGPYLERRLRQSLNQRIAAELIHQARTARELVLLAADLAPSRVDQIADRLGVTLAHRVTIIAVDGTVVGDSALTVTELAAVENHGNRPEVIAALAEGEGSSQRYSTTVNADMHYTAVSFDHGAGAGVVRIAKPLVEIDAAVASLRWLLVLAGLIGLLAAAVVAWISSHLLSRALRMVADSARAIAAGGTGRRIEVTSKDELGAMAGSLNRMAEEIESTVSALAGERARFEAVLESMTGVVIALDSDKRVSLVNSAARSLLCVGDDYAGSSLAEIIRAPALLALVSAATIGEAASGELELALGDRQLVARLAPRSDGQGWVLVMHDVTALRRLETVRRDFVANVSHELRTPVSIISANAETLIDGGVDDLEYRPKLLDATLRNARRLGTIIEELLTLSRLEAGRFELERELVSVAEVAASAVDSVEAGARVRETAITLAVDADLAVAADPEVLEEVLINLVDNAVKHTPAGSRVDVTAHSVEGAVRIEVRDNGNGIDRRHRERVFERFYRVDPGRSREMGGTGLGLSIVRHMVEAMDGSVGVSANHPKGAIFWLELPRS